MENRTRTECGVKRKRRRKRGRGGGKGRPPRHWKRKPRIKASPISLTQLSWVSVLPSLPPQLINDNAVSLYIGCPPPKQEHIDLLKRRFGHSNFKPSVHSHCVTVVSVYV